ncbi:MAG: HAD family hydrolase [Dehalococcoidia bacterium]
MNLSLPSFEMPPKAVAIDLDGTLLNSAKIVSKRNLAALDACLDAGMPIVIATSRPARAVRRVLGEELLSRLGLVHMSGAAAQWGLNEGTGHSVPLESGAAEFVLEATVRLAPFARVAVETRGWEFALSKPVSPELLWAENSATPDMLLTVGEALTRGPSKVSVNGFGEDLGNLAGVLAKEMGHVLDIILSDAGTFINAPSIQTSKPAAICALLSPLGIDLSEVMAFGDDTPDLAMLQACGIPVAMANATGQVKSETRYTTDSNDADGVALVLERLVVALDQGSSLLTLG